MTFIWSKNTQKPLFILSVLILAFTWQSAAIIVPGDGSCCDQNIIAVSGDATVTIQPDIARISAGVSSTEQTSQLATSGVAAKINQIRQILSQNGIPNKDIETDRLSIYPKYEYTNGRSEIVGQTASQNLNIVVRNIEENGENIANLIDALATIDGINVNNLSFDKEDKSAAQTEARKLAFENAKMKASEYASLAERGLGRVVSIHDGARSESAPVQFQAESLRVMSDSAASTSVAVGELEVSYNVDVKFSLR